MAAIGLYIFGTSILWGQGHKDANKMHTRLVSRVHPVRAAICFWFRPSTRWRRWISRRSAGVT